jgi:cytochrome c oxidase subunit III
VTEAHSTLVAEQFDDREQQHEAANFGMWIFLATEVMFFGGLFASYTIFRNLHYEAFRIGSHHLAVQFGAANTAVLILSSLTMALAVHAAQTGRRRALMGFLVATLILGLTFLGVKWFFEWTPDYLEGWAPGVNWKVGGPESGQIQLFMFFYFMMTGVHALHMVVGIGELTVLIVLSARGHFPPERPNAVEMAGLYWHFVDIIWIFLFPLLYLIGGRYGG